MAKESMQIHKKPKLQQTKLNFFITKKPANDTAPVNNKKRKLESSITDDQQIMPPPKLSPIELIYSEQEIWTRLEIREFLFRFGHLYEFDSRFLGPLQNVQGDWRMKRFGGMIVWRCLYLLSTRSFELSANTKQLVKTMMHNWMEERDILDLYDRPEEQNQAFAEVLQLEGMTASRWQDVVELVREANEEDVPDIKGNKVIQEDELKITLKLLGLLLFEEGARQSFIGISKEREAEHKREVKEYHIQESSNKSRRKILSNKVHQLQSLKRKENEMKEVKRQLEELETLIRDECATFHSKKLEFIRQALKSNKRMQPAGRDKLGNEYWMFNDLMDQACRNSEPYWAYGIIVIGPGYEGHEIKWWAVEGKKEMEKLGKWLKWHHDQEVKSLIESIHQRVDYLNSLEWSVYGEGFFS